MNTMKKIFQTISLSTILCLLATCSPVQGDLSAKETFLPSSVWNVKEKNDYNNPKSQFSKSRMIETENLVAFWEADFGDNPETCSEPKFRFPLRHIMEESEKMYVFFRDKLKFVQKGNSLTDKYRMNLYIYYNEDGTVYGGGADEKIGVMWLSPGRIKHEPYGAMAHEMGHAFQYMVSCDGNWGFSGHDDAGDSRGQAIFEMTSQYMLWQYYPEWITFENYHLRTFMENTYKAFLHEDNRYCSPFVLEYWASKHGADFIGKLWMEAKAGEDPAMTYKRMTGISQSQFNDEIFDACRRFVTWDIDRIREVSKQYANQHATALNEVGDNLYRITKENCPQNYGYNAIRLEVPKNNKTVSLEFEGIANSSNFRMINADKAGWRYGFLAMKENGERVYGDVYSNAKGKVNFNVPENTTYLWLIVSGAPTEHWEHVWDDDSTNDEQWPYQITLSGTAPYQEISK